MRVFEVSFGNVYLSIGWGGWLEVVNGQEFWRGCFNYGNGDVRFFFRDVF